MVKVVGHPDELIDSPGSRIISGKRALAMADYFIEQGVDPNRIEVEATSHISISGAAEVMVPSQPVASEVHLIMNSSFLVNSED